MRFSLLTVLKSKVTVVFYRGQSLCLLQDNKEIVRHVEGKSNVGDQGCPKGKPDPGLQGGLTLAPGHVFSATYQFSNFIRLNAATFKYSIEHALERLGEMVHKLAK